jgi:patatin-related protein
VPQTSGQPENSQTGGVRELRLAVVLYGGVSLAIYMHGTTKELHRLVKASALEDRGAGATGDTASERVYQRLLRWMSERDKRRVRTRVVVDVIAGTSAGGINGIYLAKALAHNRSQDKLRDVWLDRGDISVLLRGPARIPWRLRAPGLLARARSTSPLNGEAMSRWLYEALDAMDVEPSSPSGLKTLMPDGHELELFVTATDFSGYDRELVITDPRLVHDEAHRHVLRFRHSDRGDDFGRDDNGWLAFSARATSSFPGAFAPVSPREFERAVRPAGGLRRMERFFRVYALSHATADERFFVDGGVLDNRPFGHVIRAIRERPAGSQVDRRLLYLEPDPGGPGKSTQVKKPSPVATVLGSVAGIPRKQPILDEILEVTRHNERVRRLRDIIEMAFGTIEPRVQQIVGIDLERLVEAPPPEDLARWSDQLNQKAEAAAGVGYHTYLRSKVSAVVERYARTICELSDYPDDCNQAAFVHSVLRAWARDRLFTEREGRLAPEDHHVDFLRTFDLDYGTRRLRFVIDALSWWYKPVAGVDAPSRANLDRGKAALYEKHSRLTDAMSGRNLGTDLKEPILACFEQRRIDEWPEPPERYAGEHADDLLALEHAFADALNAKLDGFSAKLFAAIQEITAGWSGPIRKALLVRYLGFPLWDAILFPVQSVADVGERDKIEVVRFSPQDARQLPAPEPKLSGVSKGHFGAFFDRSGRERDYLWGRLDGAERLIGMLLGPKASEVDRVRWCREAFAAIADEEQGLHQAAPLLAEVRRVTAGAPADQGTRRAP